MSNRIQKILVALLFASCILGGRNVFAVWPPPLSDTNIKVNPGGVQLTCIANKDCTQSCASITVNTATLDTSKCYKTDNGNSDPAKNVCGLQTAIDLAATCTSPSTIAFNKDGSAIPSNTITLTAALSLNPKSSVTIDGQSGRFTIKSAALPTAFDINGTNGGSVKIDNILFSGFTGPVIKLESGATNFRLGYVTADANVKVLDNSLAGANNADGNIPLLLAQNGGTLNFFAVVPLDAEDIKTKLRFIDTTSATSFDFLSDNNLTDLTSLKTHTLKDASGNDPSGGTKTVLEGVLPVGLAASNKFQIVLINQAGKNVSIVNLNPNPWPYKDSDGDSLADSFDPNPTSAGTNFEDFYKFFACSGTDCSVCSDGSKIVTCNSSLTAGQATNPPAPASGASSSGCSLVWQNSENGAFGFVSVAALCLGILAGRRLRFSRVKK